MSIIILVADSSQAHFYKIPSVLVLQEYAGPNRPNMEHQHPELEPFRSYYHPESKEHDSEIGSDRFGNYRSGDSSSSGSTYLEENTPQDHEKQVFAKQVADILEERVISGDFKQIVLAGPPEFLGELKKDMSTNVQNIVLQEINKDFTYDWNHPRVLAKHLASFF